MKRNAEAQRSRRKTLRMKIRVEWEYFDVLFGSFSAFSATLRFD